jgi:SNF2 family DNA or RNA helicase
MDIKVDKSIKLKGKLSTFVKVLNEPEALKIINSFSKVYYHSDKNIWELPKEAFRIFVSNYKGDLIIHQLDEASENYLSKIEIFENEDLPYMPKTSPFSHQILSINYAKNHNKFLLADEQGLGKTKQSIDIALSHKNKFKHCLIVCGVNSLKWNWLNEIAIHSNEKGYVLGTCRHSENIDLKPSISDRIADLRDLYYRDEFFIITNVESLRDKEIQKWVKHWCDEGVIGMTIIDEIHKCKNSQSAQGKGIHACTSYYKLALTGTPLMNECIDLYNILKWLEVENHTLTQWKNYYCQMGGFGGYQIVGYNHTEELQSQLNSIMLRRTKEEVLDLPPKIYTNEYLEMSDEQFKIYKEVEIALRKDIDKILLSPNPLVQLIRLRQATGLTSILSTNVNESIKFDRLLEILEEVKSNNGKLVVFTNWTSISNPLYDMLKEKGYKVALATGQVNDVSTEINKFKNDPNCHIIIGTIGVLGTGFTLTEASTIVFLDEPWNMATKLQAEDRCHRIGTNSNVNIITLLCKDTIDERIHKIITKKGILSDAVVDNKYTIDDIKYLLEGGE